MYHRMNSFSLSPSRSVAHNMYFFLSIISCFSCATFSHTSNEKKKAHIKVSGRHTQKSRLHSLVLLRTENGEGKGEKKKIEAKHVKTYVWKVFANNRTATNTLEIFARTRAISSITWNKSFADFPIFFSLSVFTRWNNQEKKPKYIVQRTHSAEIVLWLHIHRNWQRICRGKSLSFH